MIIFTFGKYAAKRKTVGISGSKFYSKVKAGGAYILNTAGNVIVRMPIRRLKEQTEEAKLHNIFTSVFSIWI